MTGYLLPWPTLVLAYVAAWLGFALVSGWVANRWPLARLERDGWLTRSRRFERKGRFYESTARIKRWKDRLPEAGDFYRGGVSKRRLPDHSSATLARFVVETRRAELVHWSQIAFAPTFVLWNPIGVSIVMVVFALVAHLPFVAIQRYNRARLLRTLERRHGVNPQGASLHAMLAA